MMLTTCTCILAVDFTCFPRRFVKSEVFGTGLVYTHTCLLPPTHTPPRCIAGSGHGYAAAGVCVDAECILFTVQVVPLSR